jgi:hypothetical protein
VYNRCGNCERDGGSARGVTESLSNGARHFGHVLLMHSQCTHTLASSHSVNIRRPVDVFNVDMRAHTAKPNATTRSFTLRKFSACRREEDLEASDSAQSEMEIEREREREREIEGGGEPEGDDVRCTRG